MITWEWSNFENLSKEKFIEILRVRQEVFVVEQDCPYLDIDGLDEHSWHLVAWDASKEKYHAVAYLRVVHPTYKYNEPSIGRVLTVESTRGTGLGKELMTHAIKYIEQEYPHQSNRISAQQYLEKFYQSFGFTAVSDVYDEDGIPHIEMIRSL